VGEFARKFEFVRNIANVTVFLKLLKSINAFNRTQKVELK